MIDVPLTDGPLRFAGILDARPVAAGLRLGRLPAWTQPQYPDPMTRAVVAMPSGARIELETDTTTLTVEALLTRIAAVGRKPFPSVFDLVVDGELVASQSFDAGNLIVTDPADPTRVELQRGEPVTVTFDGLDPGPKRLEVWLPQSALLELRGVRIDDGAAASAPSPDGRRRWIHYGSSISHCMEADRPTGVWPAVAARLAGVELRSFGLGGSCHLDQFVARTIRDLPLDLLSMKVGINVVNGDSMTERAFVPAVHGFLDTVRDGHPDIPILVVSPIFCPAVEDHPGPTVADETTGVFFGLPRPVEDWRGSLTLRRIRELLEAIVAQRGDPHLHYLDGLALFGAGDASDLPDGLHPNAAGYRRMGERFHNLAFAPGGPFGI